MSVRTEGSRQALAVCCSAVSGPGGRGGCGRVQRSAAQRRRSRPISAPRLAPVPSQLLISFFVLLCSLCRRSTARAVCSPQPRCSGAEPPPPLMAPPSPSGRGQTQPQPQTEPPSRPTNQNQQPQWRPQPRTRRCLLLLLAALVALLTASTPQCARAQTTGPPPPMTLPQRAGRGRWEGRGKGELTAVS